jgi:hypothetical protein
LYKRRECPFGSLINASTTRGTSSQRSMTNASS